MILRIITCGAFLTFSILFAESSIANDAPLNLVSGAALPIDGQKTKVKMVSEIVRIDLNDENYIVDAEFSFFNEALKPETISVGFPKRSEGYLDERYKFTDEFIKFEAWVNGAKTEVQEKMEKSTLESSASIPDTLEAIRKGGPEMLSSTGLFGRESKWMVRSVDFSPKKKTITRVRYEAKYQDFGNCYGARYIFGTGSYWNGKIGNSKFIITCNAKDGCWDQIQDESKGKKYKASRKETAKGKTVEYQMKNFEPDADDQIFMTVGCPD
jgi:hypothetical protein